MRKNLSMIIKIAIILLVLLFLWLIFRDTDTGIDEIMEEIIEDIRIPAPQGEFSRVEDVLIMAHALNEDMDADDLIYRLIDMYRIDIDAKLKYDDFQKLMTAINLIPEERFTDKYQPEHYFLLSDWKNTLNEMIEIYNRTADENIIAEIYLTVLGFGEDIIDHEGNVLAYDQLITSDIEVMNFKSSIFRLFPYHTIKALSKNDELLILTDIVNENMVLKNVFFLGEDDEMVGYFYRDYEIIYRREEILSEMIEELIEDIIEEFSIGDIVKEQLADLTFEQGHLRIIDFKNNVISGKLLAVDDETITIEGHGVFEVSPDIETYRLYDRMRTMMPRDLAIGYEFTDFVLEDGKICGALMVRREAMEYIRVAVRTTRFQSLHHEEVRLSADVDFTVTYGPYNARETKDFEAGERLNLSPGSELLNGGNLIITPSTGTGRITLFSVNRSQGVPVYRGIMEIKKTDNGLAVINEVLLEEYLFSVVPSEMPASYPLEALKAQAITARTYAYRFIRRSGLPVLGAHVDDSVGYQVYNNIAEHMNTTKAVKETTGLKLFFGNNPAATYYYSTSSGNSTIPEIWKSQNPPDLPYLKSAILGADRFLDDGTALDPHTLVDDEIFAAFITTIRETDFEKDEAWYRWTYEATIINHDKIGENIKWRYDRNHRLVQTLERGEFVSKPIGNVGKVTDIYSAKRLPGGVIDELIIETTTNTYKIIAENTIRYVLFDNEYNIIRQDGSEVSTLTILPSAFMIIEPSFKEAHVSGFKIIGGGFGHGVGMAQNGARALARLGYTFEEILAIFYIGCEVRES